MIALAYYLIKVVVCSGILFLYYHLALRNKLFHQWNRFYLLASVILSLLLPLLQISFFHYSNEPNKAIQLLKVAESADNYMEEIYIRQGQAFGTDQWIIMGYAIVSTILLTALLLSIGRIVFIIRKHHVQIVNKIKIIITEERGTPFSFFRYIFWNKKLDLESSTGQQIFQHELVHVKDAHTLDKLFVQLTLIFFWCNPFFWLIRKELRMIHEFIADKKAVHQNTEALAAIILQAAYSNHFNHITNHFFQSSIKRRLLMLAKNQNPRISYLSRILALPIIAFVVLAFSFRTKNAGKAILRLDKEITVVIDAGHGKTGSGEMSGAKAENTFEDAIVLTLAKRIKELNANKKINIELTRTSDEIVDLYKRVDIAKEKKADLFISLHVGAVPEGLNKSGIDVYVSNKNTPYQKQSEALASALGEELNSIYPANPQLIRHSMSIWVVDKNVCPSVLVECGYITNKKDREFITNETNQKAVAEKILSAIERYAALFQSGKLGALEQQGKGIKSIHPNTYADRVTVIYVDNSSETITIDEARKRKLIDGSVKKDKESSVTNTIINKQAPEKHEEPKPIYYVNGKEFADDPNKIDPNAIQAISVLKDQSAVAKYGEKGKNGVVEINLKSGTELKLLDTVPKKANVSVFTKPEIEASVDKNEWRAFLEKNLQSVIENATKEGMPPGQYTVNIRFIVKKDGNITDFKALNDPGYGLVQKVLEIIPNSPKWKPAKKNGKAVNSYHTQPITFVISDGIETDEANSAVTNTSQLQAKDIHSLIGANKADEIVSFEMMLEKKDGWVTVSYHKGNSFTASDKEVLQNISQGNKLVIWKINVLRNGEERKLNTVTYKL